MKNEEAVMPPEAMNGQVTQPFSVDDINAAKDQMLMDLTNQNLELRARLVATLRELNILKESHKEE